MMNNKKGTLRHSLRFKLALSVFIMTLPLVGMLMYTNFYAIHVVREQVSDTYINTLRHHLNQIDDDLNNIDAYMHTIAGFSSSDLMSLSMAESDTDYYMNKVYLFNKLSDDFPLYRSLNAFFVYVSHREDYMHVYDEGFSFNEKERVQKHIIQMIDKGLVPRAPKSERWKYEKIGDDYYLIDIVQAGDTYLGAWIKMDNLLKPLRSLDLGEGGQVLFANEQGIPITDAMPFEEYGIELKIVIDDYYLSGDKQKHLVIGERSNRGNFALYALIPDGSILENLPFLQRLIWIITIVALLVIPFGFYTMVRSFLVPLGRVLLAMKKVRSGDWSTRVEIRKTSNEFRILGYSFNAMMDEIQRLRVNVYEEQINKQREELQRLQLQINPHFFLNSLNIVYNLAKVKNYRLIMKMTMALIRYFRYLFRSNTTFVKLGDELEHTRDYLNIQALRFPDKLTWDITAPEYLADIPVPPLILQTFAENSIKYAVTMEELTHIQISASYADDSGSHVFLRVKDSGSGFEEHVLRALQAGKSMQNDHGEHTGIWNVQRRLRLLYQGEASIRFHNDKESGGAVVSILLPAESSKEETS